VLWIIKKFNLVKFSYESAQKYSQLDFSAGVDNKLRPTAKAVSNTLLFLE